MLNLSNNLAVPEHKLPENEELSEKCFARPRSWTQRDHADHDYHEWAEKQSAIEEAQLARGEIPLETSDKLRLVDYNLPVSQQFEELALRSIRELCPEYDLDRHPLRIMLADLPGQNAYYIDGSHPATIAINTGVLVGPDAVKSVDEFEAFLLHEVGHVLRRIAGVTENSRAEETQNEVEAAVTLQRHGRSPMVVLDFAHSAKKREKVDEILGLKEDIHLSRSVQISALELTLTMLELEYGSLSKVKEELESDHELAQLVAQALHVSYVERELRRIQESSDSEVPLANALCQITLETSEWTTTRAKEISRRLPVCKATELDPDQGALFETIIELIVTGNPVGEQLYAAWEHYLAPANVEIAFGELRPWGPLAELADAAQAFISAADERSILSAFEEFGSKLFSLPTHSPRALRFIKSLRFPSFLGVDSSWELHLGLVDVVAPDKREAFVTALCATGVRSKKLSEACPNVALPYLFKVEALLGRPSLVDVESVIHIIDRNDAYGVRSYLADVYKGGEMRTLFETHFQSQELSDRDYCSVVSEAIKTVKAALRETKTWVTHCGVVGSRSVESNPDRFVAVNRLIYEEAFYAAPLVKGLEVFLDSILKRDQTFGYNLARKLCIEDPNSPAWHKELRVLPVSFTKQFLSAHGKRFLDLKEFCDLIMWRMGSTPKALVREVCQIEQQFYSAFRKLIPQLPAERWPSGIDIAEIIQRPDVRTDKLMVDILAQLFINLDDRYPNDLAVSGLIASGASSFYAYVDLPRWQDRVPLNQDLGIAASQWRRFAYAGMLSPRQAQIELHELLGLISDEEEPQLRCEVLEEIIFTHTEVSGKSTAGLHVVTDVLLRAKLVKAWTNSLLDLFGRDDGSRTYQDLLKPTLDAIAAEQNPLLRFELCDALADAVCCQAKLGRALRALTSSIRAEVYTSTQVKQFLVNLGLELLFTWTRARMVVLELLSSGRTETDIQWSTDELNSILTHIDTERKFPVKGERVWRLLTVNDVENLCRCYESWPLEGRSVLLRNLLSDAGHQAAQDLRDMRRYVLSDKLMIAAGPKRGLYERIGAAYLAARSEHMQCYLLAAALASHQPGAASRESFGRTVVSFGTKLGILHTKFLQTIGIDSRTDEYIRAPAQLAQCEANPPSRLTWLAWMDERDIPPELFENLGEMLGSAANFVTIDRDSTVLQFARPHAPRIIEAEAEILREAAARFWGAGNEDPRFLDCITNSRENCLDEINAELWSEQFALQREAYHEVRAHFNGKLFVGKVPRLLQHGSDWREVEKAPGTIFLKLAEGEERTERALVTTTFILRNIFRGQRFDRDPNAANSLHHTTAAEEQIWFIDPGQMRLAPVESAERQLIGQCAARIVTAASKDRSPLQVLDQAVDSFRSPTGKPPRLISDLHSALVIGGNYTRELDPKHIQGAVFSAFKGAHPEILAQLPRKIRIALRVKRPLIQFIEESSIQ